MKSPTTNFERMSRLLKYDSKFLLVHKHIAIYIYIYGHLHRSLYRDRLRAGVIMKREYQTPHSPVGYTLMKVT